MYWRSVCFTPYGHNKRTIINSKSDVRSILLLLYNFLEVLSDYGNSYTKVRAIGALRRNECHGTSIHESGINDVAIVLIILTHKLNHNCNRRVWTRTRWHLSSSYAFGNLQQISVFVRSGHYSRYRLAIKSSVRSNHVRICYTRTKSYP